MRKSQTTAFLLLLFYVGNFIFYQKTYLQKLSLDCYICIIVFSRGRLLEMVNTNAHIDIHWFCRRHTSIQKLGNRLGISTQILIAMDYFFYLYISEKYLQFRKKKYINLGNQFHYKKYKERDRNISKTFVFIFHHSI